VDSTAHSSQGRARAVLFLGGLINFCGGWLDGWMDGWTDVVWGGLWVVESGSFRSIVDNCLKNAVRLCEVDEAGDTDKHI
jgi:hypothetical protein